MNDKEWNVSFFTFPDHWRHFYNFRPCSNDDANFHLNFPKVSIIKINCISLPVKKSFKSTLLKSYDIKIKYLAKTLAVNHHISSTPT